MEIGCKIELEVSSMTGENSGAGGNIHSEPGSEKCAVISCDNSEISTDTDLDHLSSNIPAIVECSEMKQQIPSVIILQAADSNLTGTENNQDDESLEPASKRFCVESIDGQTYVVTMPEDGGIVEGLSDVISANAPDEAQPAQSVDVSQAWFTSRDDKTALQFKGQSWRQGQWSKEEVLLLQVNIENYCKDFGFTDPAEIVFGLSKDERKDFYRTVAKGLNRPLFSVYRRVIRMYDKKNYVGKYTPAEIKKLIELRKKHGSDWAAIGAEMGRSASSVKDRCRLLRETCNTGKWYPDEEQRLGDAVYKLTGSVRGENITTGVSWAAVAEDVRTRTEKQCRTKWLNYLNWKQKGGSDWTRDDDNALVNKIASMNAQTETDVDWNELAKGWNSVRSPQWLRGKWWSLKKHVQNYQLLSFPDIVSVLKQCQDKNCHSFYHAPVVKLRQRVSLVPATSSNIPISSMNKGLLNETSVPVTSSALISEDDLIPGHVQYELLTGTEHHLMPTSSGTYLITQPQNNPAISFCNPNMTSDHIIVHTLPIQVTDSIQNNDDVTIQLNDQQIQVIDNDSTNSIDQDINELPIDHVDVIQKYTRKVTDDRVAVPSVLEVEEQCQIIGREPYTSQSMHVSDITDDTDLDGTVVDATDLVMAPPQYAQSNGSTDRDIYMSTLCDPMLNSDTGDLIATSDVENEKTNISDSNDG
ncbi:cyclin-D-binding Myb-like transcription factor 1 [Tubulanus polymorphus]|uniref:cyclin-D-binding Myb-like transcription factor 1 n=1 Tax=Tubulanus polymorphus TaxID=672921 RepID=UPI003DA60ADB